MVAQEIARMFHFNFEKHTAEIVEKAKVKIEAVKAKIAEREARISALRKEYGIDDAALIELLTTARRRASERDEGLGSTYVFTSISCAGRVEGPGIREERTVGAGAVNNLLTESDFIESEKAQMKQLTQIVNNLRPQTAYTNSGEAYAVDRWTLSYQELEYLGF